MNAVENIQYLTQKYFGIEFKVTQKQESFSNNCTGALIRNDDFHEFKANFISLLLRLSGYYKTQQARQEIANKLKELAISNKYGWAGYYSELIALDVYAISSAISNIDYINIFKRIDGTLAQRMSQKKIDIDLSFILNNKKYYTDIKAFKSLNTELYDDITQTAMELVKKELKQQTIIAVDNLEPITDEDTSLLGNNKKEIIDCILNAVRKRATTINYTATNNLNIKFKISYGHVLTTITTKNPVDMADVDYKKIYKYANKLLARQPSLLTFIANPWFNKEFINTNSDFFKIYFKKVATNIFANKSQAHISDKSNITFKEFTENLSGLIFIVDNSIKSSKCLYDLYIYFNPNATNADSRVCFSDFETAFKNQRFINLIYIQ